MSISEKAAGLEVLEALADHLAESGISVEEVGRISKMGGYQTGVKLRDENGVDEFQKHDLFKWEIAPTFDTGPEWQPVDRGPAVKIAARKTPTKKDDGFTTEFYWPDTQIGYWRDIDGTLVSTHDEGAIDIALQILRDVQPDRVIRVGDDADLPEMGKYRVSPAFAGTTQASIDRLTVLNGEQRAAAPNAEIDWLAGNHEERMSNYILDNARAAFGLRKGRFAHEVPSKWPTFSIPEMTRVEEFGINFVPGFPAAHMPISDELRVVHGLYVTNNGSTASKYLARERTSVIYGHVHRREYAARTLPDGHEIFAASPGCLARVDGAVPSTRGGMDLDGRPLSVVEDWQQGVGISETRNGVSTYQNIEIKADGPIRFARYNGKTYESSLNEGKK